MKHANPIKAQLIAKANATERRLIQRLQTRATIERTPIRSALPAPVARIPAPRFRSRLAFRHIAMGFQRPRAAPVGSTMMLNQPIPGTSVTSFMTFAPRDFAFEVDAWMSLTNT